VKAAVRELAPSASAEVAMLAVPELTATGLPIATPPSLKVTLPAAAAGVTVAVRVTLAPKDAVVIATVGAEVSPASNAVVVVACATVTVDVPEVLVTKLNELVGMKTAVRELAPSASAEVARVAVPELTATGFPMATPPSLKVTAPTAVEGVTVAVSVTLAPKDAVVIATVGAEVRPAFSTVVVAVAVPKALAAVINNNSKVARLPQPLKMFVEATIAF